MDRFQVMRLFVRIVERANFAGAARDLQVPRATVTRAIQQLEAQLGVRLLERTTRAVRPTEDGAFYYSRCVQLLADLEEVESGFRDGEPNGPLSVDLQGTLARHFVLPALPEFIARYPAITLRLSETDRMVDPIQEGIDCVLRAGALPDSSLVGRQVAASEQLTLASPDYLRRHGVPTRLEDLASHRMVAYAASSTGQPYALDFLRNGFRVAVRPGRADPAFRPPPNTSAAAIRYCISVSGQSPPSRPALPRASDFAAEFRIGA
jgi:DNA-binding transcriptional LysR family regulator